MCGGFGFFGVFFMERLYLIFVRKLVLFVVRRKGKNWILGWGLGVCFKRFLKVMVGFCLDLSGSFGSICRKFL